MNPRTLAVCASAFLAYGCESNVDDDVTGSFFYLFNQTEYPLRIEWTERDNPDAGVRRFGPVPSGERREFASEDTSRFFAPEPSDVFESVVLYRADTNTRVYAQEPPNDDAWEKEVLQVRFGELRTQYTLRVREEDLTP